MPQKPPRRPPAPATKSQTKRASKESPAKESPAKNGAAKRTTKKRASASKSSKVPSADRSQQVKEILRRLAKAYPQATCALIHESPYQLLVATILSAQCTDERVNMVTPKLFAKYPDLRALAEAPQADLEEIIRSTGFFRAKANSLRGMAEGVLRRFGGEIPKSLDDLVTLPGVGRKTANVLLGTAWGIPSGVVVDTHVKRIVRLLGLTKSDSPEQIEQDLMAIIPQKEWIDFSHRLIHHGRKICIARRPKCHDCPLLPCCDRVGLPPLD